MIAVDTNIVVRLLTQDDPVQYQKSLELFQNPEIFISNTVILETEWVLRFAYKFKRNQVCSALRKLVGLPNVYLTNPMLVHQALLWHENGLDFADALHLAQSQDCQQFYTFDEKFIKNARELTNCEVKKPGD
ncbi:type II toxin-antitoxin system VapC family toxin [Limnospira fusiformis KN01]|uniref:type II toxin-antitoxin system VapC family toxin n=1 Tax=Limnospira fusiformis TaxID=54297 RepID=UPI0016587D2D|nr:type II toxin-antitoxin system VapC family toxin [Limnospira fusiformis]ULB45464.1 type II toxin-antitoxin system VapC family toxin [Limnospira fusiformis KN01]